MNTRKLYHLFAALCTVLALTAVLPAWAQAPVFTISQSTSGNVTTSTLRRPDASVFQYVECRTISLSAIAGKHFTVLGEGLRFNPGEYEKTLTVVETPPEDIDEFYRYQNGISRTYRVVVCDPNGFVVASTDRTIEYGDNYMITNDYVNSRIMDLLYFSGSNYASATGKYVDVPYNPNTNSQHKRSGDYVLVTDKDLYGNATLCNISTSKLFTTAGIPQHYLESIGNKVYATVAFTMKEKKDGYQYIQILTDERESYDGTDPDGDVAMPIYARYKACFELSKTKPSVVTDDHKMFFPHRYNTTNGTSEFDYSDSYLYKQLFRDAAERPSACGALILSPSVNEINVRFDARGKDDDDWYFKNLFVRLAIIDETPPTLIDEPYASPGFYRKETDFYISVPFSEIVTVNAQPTLSTNWGTATYYAGSGTNVLTFKGKIDAAKETRLQITSISGGISDLAGNLFTGKLNYTFPTDIKVTYHNLIINGTTQVIGLESEYTFYGDPVEPRPTTVYFYKGIWDTATRTTLVEGTDYTLSWKNNTKPGTAQIIITGKGNYQASVTRDFNLLAIPYTVHFDANGGEGTMDDQAFIYGVAQQLTPNAFTRNGYTFAGWSTTLDGEVVYTDKQQVKNLTTTDGGSVTLYAQWTLVTYHITYNLNGGKWPEGTLKPENYTVLSGGNIQATPVREGYRFAGWTGTGLDTLTFNIVIPIGSTGDRTYTANWTDLWGVTDGADGTEAHPYVITTTEGLDFLAERVNAGTNYYGTYFVLGADIAYNPKALTIDNDGNGSADSNYTPIGTSSHCFHGTFDGQNHTISGIRVDNPQNDYQGLFGNAMGNTIKNVILTGTRITGHDHVGGIVGYNEGCTIKNCHVTEDVVINGRIMCGGIGGGNWNNGKINGCTSAATINGDNVCGGIGGFSNGEISDCLAIDVTLSESNSWTGAIVGQNGFPGEVYGTLSYNYYHGGNRKGCGGEEKDVDIHGKAQPGYFITLEEDVAIQEVIEGEVATFTIPDHKELNATGTALTDAPAKTYTVAPRGIIITLAYNGTVPQGYRVAFHYTDTEGIHDISGTEITMRNRDITIGVHFVDNRWGIADGADGSKEHPYVIISPYELDLLATQVNAGTNYKGKYFVLGADIEYAPVANDGSNASNYTPIGTFYCVFSGTFDGQGHTVRGIHIYSNNGYQGLFGVIGDSGTVRNVILADAQIMGDDEVGGIAGRNYGIIDNCHVADNVVIGCTDDSAYDYGGIAGINSGTVNGCTSSVTITFEPKVYSVEIGGIVGENTGTVSNCRAIGANINGSQRVGAFAGRSSGNHSYIYFYDCYINNEIATCGISDYGGVSVNNNSVSTEGVPLLGTCSNDYVLDMCRNKWGYLDFTLAGHNFNSTSSQTTTWDFFCLPFYIDYSDFPMLSSDIVNSFFYTLDSEATQVSNDTLRLYFRNITKDDMIDRMIPAGTPFAIKREKDNDNEISYFSSPFPTFHNKTLTDEEPTPFMNNDGTVTIRGSYNPECFTAPQGTYFFNPTDKTLCRPGRTFNINAFYPWIQVNCDTAINVVTLQFENEENISEIGYYTTLPTVSSPEEEGNSGAWYDLQGRKIEMRPSTQPKGIYIHKGRKVVMK